MQSMNRKQSSQSVKEEQIPWDFSQAQAGLQEFILFGERLSKGENQEENPFQDCKSVEDLIRLARKNQDRTLAPALAARALALTDEQGEALLLRRFVRSQLPQVIDVTALALSQAREETVTALVKDFGNVKNRYALFMGSLLFLYRDRTDTLEILKETARSLTAAQSPFYIGPIYAYGALAERLEIEKAQMKKQGKALQKP